MGDWQDALGLAGSSSPPVLSRYMLRTGSLMIPASRMADLIGRKKVLLTGVAVFGTSSLRCGLVTRRVT
jgi:MFS family permease